MGWLSSGMSPGRKPQSGLSPSRQGSSLSPLLSPYQEGNPSTLLTGPTAASFPGLVLVILVSARAFVPTVSSSAATASPATARCDRRDRLRARFAEAPGAASCPVGLTTSAAAHRWLRLIKVIPVLRAVLHPPLEQSTRTLAVARPTTPTQTEGVQDPQNWGGCGRRSAQLAGTRRWATPSRGAGPLPGSGR